MNPRRVGVLGGSFDPVHDAHLELARRARAQVPLDVVWFLPAYLPPHKRLRTLTAVEHRLAMLQLALAEEPAMEICTLEADDRRVHASVDTLAELRRRHPTRDFFLILGEDGFRALGSWVRPRELARLCEFVVCPRPGGTPDRPREAFGARVHWLQGDLIDLSSTRLRAALREGEEPPGLPAPVRRYVREQRLYGEEESP